MQKLVSYSIIGILLGNIGFAQNWTPDMDGILNGGVYQRAVFDVHFKAGPLGKDWIYGRWLDSDSILRYAAYRQGGKWVPLPITGRHNGGGASAMVQYGDTLYLGGMFTGAVLDGDTVPLPWTSIIKFYDDSLWYSPDQMNNVGDFAVSGDSLLVAASTTFYAPTDTFGPHLLTTNGITWSDPYTIPYPGPDQGLGGPWNRVEIHNGSVYTINLPDNGKFEGVVEWDGQQWHTFGPGIYGMVSQVYDFTFYQGQLYIGGSFTKYEDPRNPGEHIARWTGSNWETVGGGSPSPVWSFFKHDGLLYCYVRDGQFGDANIPYLAAWDGHQWCGTPIPYTGAPPLTHGFINDTLFAAWQFLPATSNGDPLSHINYFDGDYAKGPNAICSTLGIGVEETKAQESPVSVYPNPAGEVLNISLPPGSPAARVSLYNLSGQMVLGQALSEVETELKLPKTMSGLYLVVVEGEEQVFTQKVLVENQ